MIVECSHCHTKYNIDEKKVPASGVKVRCQKCQNIIFVKKEEPTPPLMPEVPTEVTKPPEPEAPKPAEPEIPKEAERPQVFEEPKPTPLTEMNEEDRKALRKALDATEKS